MSNIRKTINEIYSIEDLCKRDIWINKINPLSKFIVTIFYIVLLVSLPKTNIAGLVMMIPYLVIVFMTGEISFIDALKRLRIVLPLFLFLGIFNPIIDREVICEIAGISITSGFFSFLSLLMKGILTVFASYAFIATTLVDDFCYSLRKIHIPAIVVTEILLIYRYVTLLLKEVSRMTLAYKLRAPGQKGIEFKAWGSFVGNFLLRTMDKAETVYESMNLRGYDPQRGLISQNNIKFVFKDFLYIFIFCILILCCYKNIFLVVINWWLV